jgi:hypothetical protein
MVHGNLPPALPPGLDEAIARVWQLAELCGVDANHIWYFSARDAVVVYLAPSPPTAVARFMDQTTHFMVGTQEFFVEIVPATRTKSAAEAVQVQILAELSYWAERGLRIVAVGVRFSGDIVDVTALNPAPDNSQVELVARYGVGVELRTVDRGPSGRGADSSID